jgi:hypothetical protein
MGAAGVQPAGEGCDRLLFVGERVGLVEVALAGPPGHSRCGAYVNVVLTSATGEPHVAGFSAHCLAAVEQGVVDVDVKAPHGSSLLRINQTDEPKGDP